MPQVRAHGFTLAELLISLAILGVIATFTIPKILNAQQNSQSMAAAKEAMATISSAFQQLQSSGQVTGNTKATDLTPYLNYVSVRTTGSIDAHPNWAGTGGGGFNTCNALNPCYLLHNGGTLQLSNSNFTVNGYIVFIFDPDNIALGGTADGPSKSVQFYLNSSGRLFSRNYVPGLGTTNADPSWFSW